MIEHGIDDGRCVARFDSTSFESADLVSQRVWALVQKRDALGTHDIVTVGALIERAALSGDGETGEGKRGAGQLVVRPARLKIQILLRHMLETRRKLIL